ncbi:hypothetical protein L585_14020 [Pantoea ananatis BRT175]|nr:hypothetical protein L585_14020 [Pantoea ananatis BRT175]
MCDFSVPHCYIGKAVEALFYDAESVTRLKVIGKLSLMLREESDPVRKNEIVIAITILI